MLRNLDVKFGKPVYAGYKADADMITGMGVVIDEETKTVGFPEAETADNIYIVDKERVPTGLNAAREDFSDYEEEFVTVKQGDPVKIHAPEGSERRATDQFVATGLAIDDAMAVGTDGKWKKAAAGIESNYVYGGIHNDNGRELAIIRVVRDKVSN